MRSSNVGGQAVLEGIMMKFGEKYAIAVRKPDQEIEVKQDIYQSVLPIPNVYKIPFLRGVASFVDSLVLGMKTLTWSASFYEDEEEETSDESLRDDSTIDHDTEPKTNNKKILTEAEINKKEKKDKMIMGFTMVFSIVVAIGIFMVLPYFLSSFFKGMIQNHFLVTVIEGFIRIGLFLSYVLLVSRMKDIRRTFMYHGAEHKCINCIESGLDLTVANVMKSSKEHKRCGTSFLFFVMMVSIILFFFITASSPLTRVAIRLALLPVVAGISYEIIRFAGSSNHVLINLLSKPGLWVQKATTKEPDEGMVEVAILATEAVFDWKAYKEENF